MHALRVTPDFVSVLTKCEDWETFHELNKWLAVRQAAGISQELSEEVCPTSLVVFLSYRGLMMISIHVCLLLLLSW
jgi:hypothetical protein